MICSVTILHMEKPSILSVACVKRNIPLSTFWKITNVNHQRNQNLSSVTFVVKAVQTTWLGVIICGSTPRTQYLCHFKKNSICRQVKLSLVKALISVAESAPVFHFFSTIHFFSSIRLIEMVVFTKNVNSVIRKFP